MSLEQLVQVMEQIGWDVMLPILQALLNLTPEEIGQIIQYAQQQASGQQGGGDVPVGTDGDRDQGTTNLYGE